MKLYKCTTLGVDGTVEGDCLITGVDGANRLYCIWGELLYEGYLRGEQVFWAKTGEHRACKSLADGRIVFDQGTDQETVWAPV